MYASQDILDELDEDLTPDEQAELSELLYMNVLHPGLVPGEQFQGGKLTKNPSPGASEPSE